MKKILLVAAFIAFKYEAYSQFNTIRRIKKLPEIQVDTVHRIENEENSSAVTESAAFDKLKKFAGPLVSMPVSQPFINSAYGNRRDPLTGKVSFHAGMDFKGSSDSVMAVMPGIVKKVAYSRGLGSYIEVAHGDFKTTYGHLAFIMVKENTTIKAGTVIGVTGSTGRSTGDHLHLALKYKGKVVNPAPFLDLIYSKLEMNARAN